MTPLENPMSRTVATLLIVAFLVGGCSGVVDSLKSAFDEEPTATVQEVRIGGVDPQSLTLEFDLEVINPWSFDLPLAGLDYGFDTNAQPFLSGSADLDGSVPAEGIRVLTVPVRVAFQGLFDTIEGLRPGQVIPYDARLSLNADVPGSGPLALPLTKSGELPIPTSPEISIASVDWDEVSMDSVTGSLILDVSNPNEFAFTVKSLDYDLSLAGQRVAQGERTRSLWMSAGHQSQMSIPVSFSPADAGTALLGMLGGSQIDYALAGNVEIETSFGSLSLPYEHSGRAKQDH
jgi:LEA14-like dessication related protein